jgi:hypothetical protein
MMRDGIKRYGSGAATAGSLDMILEPVLDKANVFQKWRIASFADTGSRSVLGEIILQDSSTGRMAKYFG